MPEWIINTEFPNINGFSKNIRKAMIYKKLSGKTVQAGCCHRYCIVKENELSACRTRKNIDGELYTIVFGQTLTLEIDPVEKKPNFHFMPGTSCLSISTYGCNFCCKHCQNWDISQATPELSPKSFISPQEIVDTAKKYAVPGIAYTYTEPTVFSEYALETMKLAKKAGLYNIWVSNGYMTKETIDIVKPWLDACHIDFKGDKKFYKEVVGEADVNAVKETIKYLNEQKIHFEIINLIIPGFNDKPSHVKEIVEYIKSISIDIPMHFTAFYPAYKMRDVSPTTLSMLTKAHDIAKKAGLRYVYIGNVAVPGLEDTYCPQCGNLLISRFMYQIKILGLEKDEDSIGICKKCKFKTNIVLH